MGIFAPALTLKQSRLKLLELLATGLVIDASREDDEVADMSCIGTNKNGGPCQSPARRCSEYCYFHDPEMQAERRASQGKGGRNRSYSSTPGPLLNHFDLRDPNMRAEVLNFTVNQVLSNRLAPAMGYLVIQAAYLVRADQTAARKDPQTDKDVPNAPIDKSYDLPLLQLPETNVRQILGGYTEDALNASYDQIIAHEESKPTDAPNEHDSPKDELAEGPTAPEAAQKTSIQFLKAATIYFLDKYFWNRIAEEAERYIPGYIPSYFGSGTEFLGLSEFEVRISLSGFEPQALEDLLRAIENWEDEGPVKTETDMPSSESLPVSLYGCAHVTPELLTKMARFFLREKNEVIEERRLQRKLYEQQLEREYGPSAVLASRAAAEARKNQTPAKPIS